MLASSCQRAISRHVQKMSQKRLMSSSFSFLDMDEDLDTWPKSHPNSVLNVCPQGDVMVIERLGKMHDIREGGWFLSIPVIDNIRFHIDMREKALNIAPQSAITKDNVHVKVSGNLYCQFVDAQKAAYGSKNPIYAVKQHAQSSMRAAIGEMELDEILHARAQLNTMIRSSVQEAAIAWGLDIKRYEITEVSPDKFITEAMDKQAAAERERRKQVLEAEGDKRAAELQSEGMKIRMKNVSEGTLIKVTNEALAKKSQLLHEAEGDALAIKLRASAQAEAIEVVAKSLGGQHGEEAAKLYVARQYIDMYSDIGQKSNTMIFSEKPADVNALLAQAGAVLAAARTGPAMDPAELLSPVDESTAVDEGDVYDALDSHQEHTGTDYDGMPDNGSSYSDDAPDADATSKHL